MYALGRSETILLKPQVDLLPTQPAINRSCYRDCTLVDHDHNFCHSVASFVLTNQLLHEIIERNLRRRNSTADSRPICQGTLETDRQQRER